MKFLWHRLPSTWFTRSETNVLGARKSATTHQILKIFAFCFIFFVFGHWLFVIGNFISHTTYYILHTTNTPPSPPSVKSTSVVSPVSKFVTIISQVGEYHLTIEGYTSPGAQVELTTGLFTLTEERTADGTGYFIFRNILLHPFLSKEPCLISTDKNGVSTPPLCLARLPQGQDIHITGVILAPTLVLEKGGQKSGQTTLASGFTTPNSSVNLYLFREEKKWFFTSWIRQVKAKGAPIFSFKSNQGGYFEFNLPSYLPTTYRLFIASQFCPGTKWCGVLPCTDWCADSPKSNTLKFQVLNFIEKIILSIYNLLYLLLSILRRVFSNPLTLFLLEIAVIILLIFLLKRKKRNLSLIKYPETKLINVGADPTCRPV